jgi:hypothetical protein
LDCEGYRAVAGGDEVSLRGCDRQTKAIGIDLGEFGNVIGERAVAIADAALVNLIEDELLVGTLGKS